MKFLIGIMLGVLIISYFPDAGEAVRSATNSVASEVESATASSPLDKLEDLRNEYTK